jgi:hypothetical protein
MWWQQAAGNLKASQHTTGHDYPRAGWGGITIVTCHCWPDEHLSWSGLVANPIMLLEAREAAEFKTRTVEVLLLLSQPAAECGT